MKVQVETGKGIQEIEVESGKNLLELLRERRIYVPAYCSGRGTCGKCRIRVLSGNLEVTEADKKQFSTEELASGMRLACKAYPKEEVSICLEVASEEKMEILGLETERTDAISADSLSMDSSIEAVLAIDIGTTTIAMALVEVETEKILDSYTTINRQRMFGTDVLSRIVAANEGKGKELQRLIQEDLSKGIHHLTRERENSLSHIVIAGNTTMAYLLLGYDCEELGKYPFRATHLETRELSLGELLGEEFPKIEVEVSEAVTEILHTPVTILPGISAFVGGDIAADLLLLPKLQQELNDEEDEPWLLLDLGTNGEMVLGRGEKMLSASTAAGPAFEGGNIRGGTGSVPGAISRVKINGGRAVVGTIGNQTPPVGICGTGLISAVAELKRNRIMDVQGKLRAPYEENGFPLWTGSNGERIALYQQDIRQFQMAKAAIRAGMELLMEQADCNAEALGKVFLSGGFGKQLNIADAMEIGLFPKEFEGKIEPIGNGALQGALHYGIHEEKEKLEQMLGRVENLTLAEAAGFESTYLKHLDF